MLVLFPLHFQFDIYRSTGLYQNQHAQSHSLSKGVVVEKAFSQGIREC